MNHLSGKDEFETNAHGLESPRGIYGTETEHGHGAPEIIATEGAPARGMSGAHVVDEIEREKGGWFAYFKTKQFYIVLVLG